MTTSLDRIKHGAIFFIVTFVLATIGYVAAGWDVIDSIYHVIITIFGVGYSETQPIDTPGLKLFTIVVIVAGTSSAIYIVTGLIQLVTQGEIEKVLGARRMTRDIKTLTNHTIVCGFGRLGQILARDLHNARAPFVLIDHDTERTKEAEEAGYIVILGNATEEEALVRAGVERAAVLATVLPADASNVFITLTVRTLNKDIRIIARGEIPSTEAKLMQAGANNVILPPTIGGSRIAELILNPDSSDILDKVGHQRSFTDELSQLGVALTELEVALDMPVIGKPLSQVVARGRDNFLVVAVTPHRGETIYNPGPGYKLSLGDTITLLGRDGDNPNLTCLGGAHA